jgi:transposase
MKHVKTLGIDLAKNIFQLHGVDKMGRCVLKRRVARSKLAEVIVKLPPCLIGMEACSGAHYWARKFQAMGHTVKLMAPQFVKPYVKSNKNDANDAEGICEAVSRPRMKFVPIKQIDQQDMLLIHRARELTIKQRTAQSNQIRGLLAEYGVILPKGLKPLRELLPTLLEKLPGELPGELSEASREIFILLYKQFKRLDKQVKVYDKKLKHQASQDARCQALLSIEGVGEITATAMVATIGSGHDFKNGREVSAWIGLVPKQHSSGNTIKLSGISKRGDRYLRKLLIHGGRSVVKTCDKKTDKRSRWLKDKKDRCGANKAAVAIANKNARIIWAMLTTGEAYRKPVVEQPVAA